MPKLQIEMTEAELFALDFIAVDKQEWADNVLTDRARTAKDEMKTTPEWALALAELAKSGGDVTDDWAILLKGRELKLFKTAAEKNAAQELEQSQGIFDGGGEVNPLDLPLNQIQFFTLLEVAFGKTPEEVVQVIEATIEDSTTKIAAKNRFLRSEQYHRNSPLFEALGPALGLAKEQIDNAWLMALEI